MRTVVFENNRSGNLNRAHSSAGDALKINEGRNIVIRRVRTEWTKGQDEKNGAYDIYPGRPDESILLYRMEHTEPSIAMPELGRSTVHREGVELIRGWIAALPGDC